MTWIKPVVQNQWGYLSYHQWRGEGNAWPIQWGPKIEAGPYRVRWPDGTQTDEILHSRPHSTTVADHGHTYFVSTTQLVISTTHRGVTQETPLEKLPIELWIESPTTDAR